MNIDPEDPAPAGLAGGAQGVPIKRAAVVRWQELPAVKGSREALTIDPEELRKTNYAEFAERQTKLDDLIYILEQLHNTRPGLNPNEKVLQELTQKKRVVDSQIRKQSAIISDADTGRGGFRTPQTSKCDEARDTFAACRRQLREVNLVAALVDDDSARKAREQLQDCMTSLNDQWSKFKESVNYSAKMKSWAAKQDMILTSRIERSKQSDELSRLAIESTTHEQANIDLQKKRGELLQRRDQLLKELKIID